MILKCWDEGTQYLPPGGRGTAKRWMRNGDTLSFAMQPIQTVQTFPMYLFNEMHTNMEHIAVPHPPQCALLKHLPPGGRYGAAHPYKFQFIGLLRKNDNQNFQNHPRRGYHILYLISHILYLGSLRLRRRATARVAPTHGILICGKDTEYASDFSLLFAPAAGAFGALWDPFCCAGGGY